MPTMTLPNTVERARDCFHLLASEFDESLDDGRRAVVQFQKRLASCSTPEDLRSEFCIRSWPGLLARLKGVIGSESAILEDPARTARAYTEGLAANYSQEDAAEAARLLLPLLATEVAKNWPPNLYRRLVTSNRPVPGLDEFDCRLADFWDDAVVEPFRKDYPERFRSHADDPWRMLLDRAEACLIISELLDDAASLAAQPTGEGRSGDEAAVTDGSQSRFGGGQVPRPTGTNGPKSAEEVRQKLLRRCQEAGHWPWRHEDRVSIRQAALFAGCSRATVDNAVKGSPALREYIEEAGGRSRKASPGPTKRQRRGGSLTTPSQGFEGMEEIGEATGAAGERFDSQAPEELAAREELQRKILDVVPPSARPVVKEEIEGRSSDALESYLRTFYLDKLCNEVLPYEDDNKVEDWKQMETGELEELWRETCSAQREQK